MATKRRKELRYCEIGLQDGFSGTATIDDSAIAAADTTLLLDSATLDLHDAVTLVPVGTRFTTTGISTIRTITASNNSMVWTVVVDATSGNFTITFEGQTTANIAFDETPANVQTALEALSNVAAGELVVTGTASNYTITAAGTHANTAGLVLSATDVDLLGGGDTVTVTVVEDGTDTWELTFTPAIATGAVPTTGQTVTFLPQRLQARVGDDGTADWTSNYEPRFLSNRGESDGVAKGPFVPMDVSLDVVLDWLKASAGATPTLYEALFGEGEAADWHSSADDPCEPYCVDIYIIDTPPCNSEEAEVMIFEKFYPTQVNGSISEGRLRLTGRCATDRPTVTREAVS